MKKPEQCPRCGAELAGSAHGVVFHHSSGVVTYAGRTCRLTPFQLDFFELLLDAYPRAVPQAELMAALYDDNDERTDRVLTVQAALMRKRFRNAGLRINISSRRGWDNRSGYFLEIGDAADRNMQVA